MQWSTPRPMRCSPPARRRSSRSRISTLSRGFPSMSASCSRLFRIPCACRAALLLASAALCRPMAAQQPDEGLVGELAHLLAAADARTLDASLLGTALRSGDRGVRRQAALAAGRIGDAAAAPLLLPAPPASDAA